MNKKKKEELKSALSLTVQPDPLATLLCVCQRCLQLDLDCTVWSAKQQVICSLTESLWDVYNYGLFQPAGEGRDAKFLEEERALRDYLQTFEKGVPYLEVWIWKNAAFKHYITCVFKTT